MKRKLLIAVCLLMALVISSASALTVAGYDTDDSNGHDWKTNLYFSRISEKYGIEFEFTQYTDSAAWTGAKQAMATAVELPEVLFRAALTSSETQSLYHDGVLIDLSPYIESCMPNLNALLTEHPEWRSAITLADGSIPALPGIDELHNQNAMWINTAWLDKLGLSMPTTADELTAVLTAFRDLDPNGNGQNDEIPLAYIGMWDLRFLSHAFGVISDDYNLYMNADGTVVSPVTSEAYRAFLTWLHQLWAEKLIDHNGFTTSDSIRTTTTSSDSNAVETYGVFFAPNPLLLVSSSQVSDYSLLYPLKDENGEMIYRDTLGMLERGTFALTKACSGPEKVLTWIDSLYSEEGIRLAFLGEEGVEYEVHSDGTWGWVASEEDQYNYVHAETTIASGTSTPGYLPLNLQQNYENATSARLIDLLIKLTDYTVSPMPLVYLTDGQQAEVNTIQATLAPAIQSALATFVTGDTPLTDENWAAFCTMTEENGMQRLIEIFSSAIH